MDELEFEEFLDQVASATYRDLGIELTGAMEFNDALQLDILQLRADLS